MNSTYRYLSLLFFLANFSWLISPVYGQKEAENWLFGEGVGLSFSSSSPVPLPGNPLDQLEGIAVISDSSTGQLLFYSDGVTVWNRNNQIMPHGQSLLGSKSSTQSALIVPCPDNKYLYYLFTVRSYNEPGDDGNYGGLYYSLIDTRLANGLGDIVSEQKNKLVERSTTEKLTAIPHRNNRDFWILSHVWNSNEFLVYLLTSTGLSIGKRIGIGTVHKAGQAGNSEAMGYLRASPNGTYLAAAVYGDLRPFELYDFDNQTGTISNYRSMGDFIKQYGVSFSPDNTKLYLSSVYQFDATQNTGSYQFDLSEKSYRKTELTVFDSTKSGQRKSFINGSLQLGINGKLYASTAENGRLIVINKPNQLGLECDPQYVTFDFKTGKPLIGLPNFIQNIFNSQTNNPGEPINETCGNGLLLYPNPVKYDILTIDLGSQSCPLTKLTIYDVSGRFVTEQPINQTPLFRLDISSWSAGLYLIVFEFGKKKIVKKILKI